MSLDPSLENYLPQIASATIEQNGVAFKLDTCQFLPPMDSWSFPKYPGRTAILPSNTELIDALRDFISANEQYLREPGCWLGTWVHPITHDFYLDVATSCADLEEAKRMALEASRLDGRKIVAIYNSKQDRIVFL